MNAVAAVSAKNVWAVGCSGGCNGPDSLILHWNGKRWSKVASPDPGAGLDELTGVSAVSARNVWAVGYACTIAHCGVGNVYRTLVVHWNGKDWSQAASANPGSSFNDVRAVSAVSARDIWAVGIRATGAFRTTR